MKLNGQAIRGIRTAQGLSIEQLASAVGKSVGYVSRLERELVGASTETAQAIADALEVPVDAIQKAQKGGPVLKDSIATDDDIQLYTLDEAALRLKKSPDWITKAVRRGDIPFTRVGQSVLFSPGNLRAFIAMNQVQPRPRRRRAA